MPAAFLYGKAFSPRPLEKKYYFFQSADGRGMSFSRIRLEWV